jgi:hypothetical protein
LASKSSKNLTIGLFADINTWCPALANSRANPGDVPKGSNTQDPFFRLSAAHFEPIPAGIGGRNRERSPELSIGFPVMNGTPLIIVVILFCLNMLLVIQSVQESEYVRISRKLQGALFQERFAHHLVNARKQLPPATLYIPKSILKFE